MQKMLTRNRENPSRECESMSAKPTNESVRREAQEIVQRLAGTPSNWREGVSVGIRKAAISTGYPFGTVKKIWYRERAVIPAEIMDYLRALNRAANDRQAAKTRQAIELADDLSRDRERRTNEIRTKQDRRTSGDGRRMSFAALKDN